MIHSLFIQTFMVFGEILFKKSSEQEKGDTGKKHEESEHTEQQLCSGFDIILESLRKNPELLYTQIKRLKSLPDCNNVLGKFIPYFTEAHWEMVAVLETYDKPTFDHSLRVASFVYDLTSGGGTTEAYIRQRVNMEESSLEELFTAALFHDIGKTAIPHTVLHDNQSRREWSKRANDWAVKNNADHYFDSLKIEELSEVELDHYFMQVQNIDGSDPLNIVPLEEVFSPEILTELSRHSISPHDTFRKVLECHEKATKAILRRQKMYVASDIASHHHDYEKRPIRLERYQTEVSAVRLGFELSLLRSMDLFDALTADDRSYKHPYHPLLALEILIQEAEAEFTEPELTKYVIRDLYTKIQTTENTETLSPAETRALEKVRTFIA